MCGTQAQQTVSTNSIKLPYLGPYSTEAQKRPGKRFCNNLEIKLAFSFVKVRHIFSGKDPVLPFVSVHAYVVYKFSCAGYDACYRLSFLLGDRRSGRGKN